MSDEVYDGAIGIEFVLQFWKSLSITDLSQSGNDLLLRR